LALHTSHRQLFNIGSSLTGESKETWKDDMPDVFFPSQLIHHSVGCFLRRSTAWDDSSRRPSSSIAHYITLPCIPWLHTQQLHKAGLRLGFTCKCECGTVQVVSQETFPIRCSGTENYMSRELLESNVLLDVSSGSDQSELGLCKKGLPIKDHCWECRGYKFCWGGVECLKYGASSAIT
jgi:hypothetical protein